MRRPSGSNPCDPRYTLKTLKHPRSVMVWCCSSAHGGGALYFMEKRQKVNSEVNIDILNDKLKHFMCEAGTNILQQDNAPCHTARRVIKWLANNDIELQDWPGDSPDINPIENLWSIIKARIQEGTHIQRDSSTESSLIAFLVS